MDFAPTEEQGALRDLAARIGAEIEGESLDDKLARIREKATDANAQAELDEMKKQMAARKAAQAEGPKNL